MKQVRDKKCLTGAIIRKSQNDSKTKGENEKHKKIQDYTKTRQGKEHMVKSLAEVSRARDIIFLKIKDKRVQR